MSLPGDRMLHIPRALADAGLCNELRQLAYRIDLLISEIQKLTPEEGEVTLLPGAPGAAAARMQVSIQAIPELLALDLASFPASHKKISVDTSLTPLVENTSNAWVPVLVTNYDNAQRVHYGNSTLTDTNSPFIPGLDCKKINVPPNATLYAVVDTGAVDVAVNPLVVPRFR